MKRAFLLAGLLALAAGAAAAAVNIVQKDDGSMCFRVDLGGSATDGFCIDRSGQLAAPTTTPTGSGATLAIVGGAGGSTSGNAGAITITGGTPVSGNGGAVTITGAAGVGTAKNGGDVNLVPGAASDANGTAGLLKVKGSACVESASGEYLAASVDKAIYVAIRAMRVTGITLRVTVAGTDGSAVTVQPRKVPSGTAITSGTALTTATGDLKGTADTNQALTLSSTSSDLDLAAGNALALDFGGTLTSATGVVTVCMTPN